MTVPHLNLGDVLLWKTSVLHPFRRLAAGLWLD